MAVDDELHYCTRGGVICGVSPLRLNASDFLLYPTTPVHTLFKEDVLDSGSPLCKCSIVEFYDLFQARFRHGIEKKIMAVGGLFFFKTM